MQLKPFFCYYGGKWRAAPKYPKPQYGTIIEPFAGAAGYATRYPDREVLLVDADPVIADLWQYLIAVKGSEIRSLPLVFDHVDEIDVCPEAKALIGFWLNKGSAQPCKQPSKWMKSGATLSWGEAVRERIATQIEHIRHWRAVHASYATVPDQPATWFIDPPYEHAGKPYRVRDVDYRLLASYCLSRSGQVIVCEAAGATWMPFEPFATIQVNPSARGKRVSHEVIWYRDNFNSIGADAYAT